MLGFDVFRGVLRGNDGAARALAMLIGIGLSLAVAGCSCGDSVNPDVLFSVTVEVVDEAGAPVAGADVDVGSGQRTTGDDGRAVLPDLEGPVFAVIGKEGFLTEPIAVGRSDADGVVQVRLLSDNGGSRWVMHTGGDVMFGRRYVEPGEGEEPLIPASNPAQGALHVVSNLERAFRAADFRTVNLETVVSTLPDTAAYPGKRFILNTHPDALVALQRIGVQLVTLGNNHSRDYLDEGVRETITHLDALDPPMLHVGASDQHEPADDPVYVDVGGVRVAVLSWTTVHGSFVNDTYPSASSTPPEGCPGEDDDCFKWEERSWGFTGPTFSVPTEPRRIGVAWDLFEAAEPSMDEQEKKDAWDSLYAVYPELQDWGARRGHGGAAVWEYDISVPLIAEAKSMADVVVVQLHSGFQFQSAPSDFVRRVARYAIDGGADIVIAHHPHVLQSVEWYKDKLIAYSLGNFIFDQDFLATFPSVFLRTVWDGSTLVEARFIPIELVGYRPTPVTDMGAMRTTRLLWESSALRAYSDRDIDNDIRTFADAPMDADTVVAHLRARNHDAVVVKEPPPSEMLELDVPAGETVPIGYSGLIHARAGGADVMIGRDLFGWGHLEDATIDRVPMNGAHWDLPVGGDNDPALWMDGNAQSGLGYLELHRHDGLSGETYARLVARIPLPEHRLYHNMAEVAVPADGTAAYSIRMLARLEGAGQPYLKLELNAFDDTNPTEDPTTEPIGELDLPLDIPDDGRWHTVEVDLPAEGLVKDRVRANVVLVYIRFPPPESGETHLYVDDFSFIEWRPAADMTEHFGAYDYFRGRDADASVAVEALPLSD